jgi:hypothetical protein
MMAYRPRKNKIEINIEGDAFMPAVRASSGTPLPYQSLKEICGRIVFTHWTSETEGILYMLDKEEIAFKDVGNCQVIPGSTGEYAPDRDEKDLWEEEKRVTLEETKNIDKWNK